MKALAIVIICPFLIILSVSSSLSFISALSFISIVVLYNRIDVLLWSYTYQPPARSGLLLGSTFFHVNLLGEIKISGIEPATLFAESGRYSNK